MWICPICNQLVPNPVNKKCGKGHLLWDGRIMSNTREQSFIAAFFNTLIACVVLFAIVASVGPLLTKTPATTYTGLTLVAFIVAGFVGFLRGRTWARQGGPVARLVPRANGMAAACIIAGAAPFGIGVATGLIH